jgi:hypothetical protein
VGALKHTPLKVNFRARGVNSLLTPTIPSEPRVTIGSIERGGIHATEQRPDTVD